MMKRRLLYCVVFLLCFGFPNIVLQGQIVDESLVSKQTSAHLSEWRDGKMGMFIHWGLYSVAGGVWNGEKVPYYSEQIMNHARIPANEYEKLAKEFNPVDWNAEEVVKLAKKAGMKYIVFTSKHHDGFCMFKTKTTDYNVVDATPYGKDVVMELSQACKKYGVKLGLYYSLPDWHYEGGIPRLNPDSLTDCTEYVNQVYSPLEIITPELEDYIAMQLKELLTNYGEIETIWFDMGLLSEQQSVRFRNIVKSLQPSCLVSGRIMNNQGDYLTLPDNGEVSGYSDVFWDNPASLYGTWGFRSWQKRPQLELQVKRQIFRLMSTVGNGGVFLLNIGPDGKGNVIDYEKNVLSEMGKWVSNNADAIYNSEVSPFSKLEKVSCTQNGNKLYFTVVDSLSSIKCENLISPIKKAYLLDSPKKTLDVEKIAQGVEIVLPEVNFDMPFVVVAEFEDDSIVVEPAYISEFSDGHFELTENNGIMHAAFNSKGYLTTQSESFLTWNLCFSEDCECDVFAVYTPDFSEKEYSFSCVDTLKRVLPGVDDMMQTCYVGKMNFQKGKSVFKLESSDLSNLLEPLGLEIHKIIIRKSK